MDACQVVLRLYGNPSSGPVLFPPLSGEVKYLDTLFAPSAKSGTFYSGLVIWLIATISVLFGTSSSVCPVLWRLGHRIMVICRTAAGRCRRRPVFNRDDAQGGQVPGPGDVSCSWCCCCKNINRYQPIAVAVGPVDPRSSVEFQSQRISFSEQQAADDAPIEMAAIGRVHGEDSHAMAAPSQAPAPAAVPVIVPVAAAAAAAPIPAPGAGDLTDTICLLMGRADACDGWLNTARMQTTMRTWALSAVCGLMGTYLFTLYESNSLLLFGFLGEAGCFNAPGQAILAQLRTDIRTLHFFLFLFTFTSWFLALVTMTFTTHMINQLSDRWSDMIDTECGTCVGVIDSLANCCRCLPSNNNDDRID
jgi:hypothetical protein